MTAASTDYLIYIIDDVPEIVDLGRRILEAAGGFSCRGFTDVDDLLAQFAPHMVDCVVADLKMPHDGGELHRQIAQQDPLLSFVFISGYADVRTAVRLMQQGAVTLVEKPFTSEELVTEVRKGAERTRQLRSRQADRLDAAARLASLSPDEREVLNCLVEGIPNKSIAQKLSLSPRTVDRRRQEVLQKMDVDSVVKLAGLVTRLQTESP